MRLNPFLKLFKSIHYADIYPVTVSVYIPFTKREFSAIFVHIKSTNSYISQQTNTKLYTPYDQELLCS